MDFTEYVNLPIKKCPRVIARTDAETRYWRKFKNAVTIKEFAAVNSIEFLNVSPFECAVASAARVQIYSQKTHAVKKTLSRFKEFVHTASFRKDGKLMVTGDASGTVQIFDVQSKTALRTFNGHVGVVRAAKFMTSNSKVLSTGDDKSVRIWDIPYQKVVNLWENEHTDYVRTAAVSSTNENLAITGSYDHTVKLWDLRTNRAVLTLQHGSESSLNGQQSFHSHPVESVLMFPGDAVIVSAGGNEIRVWDILGGSSGRLLNTVSNHQKTITSLCFNGNYSRVLSGSLDQHVKIYNVTDYSVVHSVKYPAPITAVALSPDDRNLVVGTASGLLSFRERSTVDESKVTTVMNPYSLRPIQKEETVHEQDLKSRGGSFRFFLRGRHKPPSSDDLVVKHKKKPKLNQFEKYLKEFNYTNALDSALSSNLPPITIITLLEEFIHRGDALKISLSGRDDTSLEAILHFIMRHITNSRYTEILMATLDEIINLYSDVIHSSPMIHQLFQKIRRKIRIELNFQKELEMIMGSMDMLMGFSESIKGIKISE